MQIADHGHQESLLPHAVPYDPFLNPPNIALAEKHQEATLQWEFPVKTLHLHRDVFVVNTLSIKRHYPCFVTSKIWRSWVLLILCILDLPNIMLSLLLSFFLISGGAWNLYTGFTCIGTCEQFLGIGIYDPTAITVNQWTHVITCIAITLFTLYLRPKIQEDIENYKQYLNCPSHYTFMLQNLPQTISEGALSIWIQNTIGQKPIKINLSYDLTVHEQAYHKKEDLVYKINNLKMQSEKLQLSVPFNRQEMQMIQAKIEATTHELNEINKTLKEFNTQQNPPVPTGTAFVTLNTKQRTQEVVKSYGDSLIKSMTNCLFGYIRSPYPQYGKYYVLLSEAPSPRDIIWQNLLFSFVRSFLFSTISVIIMGIIIIVAFRLQGYMVNYAYQLRRQGIKTGKLVIIFESLSMSGIVVIVNVILRLVIQQFSKAQKYYSYTKYNSSFANSYFLLYFFNSALTVYIVHGGATTETSNELILWDIHVILIANAFSEPLSRLLDPTMYWRYIQRFRIKRQKPSPYTQNYVNSIWQGHSLSVADNYAYINRILFISIWFASAAPLGTLISLLGLLITYWIDKVFLLRVNKVPETISQQMAAKFLIGLQALPLIYLCGTLQFTYNISTSSNLVQFLWQFLTHGVVLFVFLISLVAYFSYWRQKPDKPLQSTYRQVEYHFKYDYDIQNPITKYTAELDYLRRVLQNTDLDPESSRKIQEILQRSMYDAGTADDMKMQIAGLKERIKQSSKGPSEMHSMYSSKTSN